MIVLHRGCRGMLRWYGWFARTATGNQVAVPELALSNC